jgi:ABC-type amino acid transport substrate-binding protein
MKTENIEIEGFNNPVVIWKMNAGFYQDWKDKASSVIITGNDRKVDFNSKNYNLYGMVFGILESLDIGIKYPSNLKLGLTDSEITYRLGAVRELSFETHDIIFKKINELNSPGSEKEIEELKKK